MQGFESIRHQRLLAVAALSCYTNAVLIKDLNATMGTFISLHLL